MLVDRRSRGYDISEELKDAAMANDDDIETTRIKPERSKRRRATKRELAMRDLKFIEKLAAGATIEEIAASEGISVKWARERKAAVLASRVIDTPHEFIKLQIHRLSEAMLVSYAAMSLGDLKAVDKVIKVARELDRYHGFVPHPNAPRFATSVPAAPPPPLALPEPLAAKPAMDWDESEPCDDAVPAGD
jgi:hypothetical protein